ncbi:hypothetical protein ABT095_29450 [Kitasatospora sp. NPDC002227]|uniref:hypothetical protein n=1 Tax=Kitasatospora sp. NPDC002227 TaxID=3154773 RepID=UPI00332A9E55
MTTTALRVVLIGGTSNVGKSTVARLLADRLGFDCRTTDTLARHPGRPWRTPGREVPAHVAEHYRSLPVEELTASVLGHYERLWPMIEELVTGYAQGDGPGLALEGSALWPSRVAALTTPGTAALWLTAEPAVLRARIRRGGGYPEATEDERALMDAFLARTVRYQELMLAEVTALGLTRLAPPAEQSPERTAAAILGTLTV